MDGRDELSPHGKDRGSPASCTPDKAPSSDEMEGEFEKFNTNAMKKKLRSVGHDDREISEWKERTAAMTSAIKEEGASKMNSKHSRADEPDEMMMLDSGTFKHLAGRGAGKYKVGKRAIKPFPVKTAHGLAWIAEECDLAIGPYLIQGCLVNEEPNTSVMSEGPLSLEEPYWEFNRNRSGLVIMLSDGTRHPGYRKGVIYYLPQSILDLDRK